MAGSYSVDRLPHVERQMQALLDQIASTEDRQSFQPLLDEIDDALANDPRAFGDPQYDDEEKGGEIYHRIMPPLSLHYVIFEAHQIVTIIRIAWVFR